MGGAEEIDEKVRRLDSSPWMYLAQLLGGLAVWGLFVYLCWRLYSLLPR